MEVDDVINDLYKLKAEVFSGKARNFTIGRHRSRIIGSGYRIKKISRWKRGDPFHLIDWQMTLRTRAPEIFMSPKYGKRRIFNAVEALLDGANDFYSQRTTAKAVGLFGVNECLTEVLGRIRRQAVVVVISDFLDVLYRGATLDEDILSGLVARHKDNVVFMLLDDKEELSWTGGIGTVMTRNIETGQLKEVKASHAALIRAEHTEKQITFQKYLESRGIDSLVLSSIDWFDKLADFAASRK